MTREQIRENLQRVYKNIAFPPLQGYSLGLQNLIFLMLQFEPSSRPTADQIIEYLLDYQNQLKSITKVHKIPDQPDT